jgi:endonuclease/exonuclease/phosphatase family metal-dependent hydrolase
MKRWMHAIGALAAVLALGFLPAGCGGSGDITGNVKVDTATDTTGLYALDPDKAADTLVMATFNMSIGFPVAQMFFKNMDDPAVAYETLVDMYSRYAKGYPTERLKQMGKDIAAEAPDVLGLQEVMAIRRNDTLKNDFLAELVAAIKANGGPDYLVFRTLMNDTGLVGKKGDSTIKIDFYEGQAFLVKPGFTVLDSVRFLYHSLLKIPLGNQPVTERGADYLRLRSPKGTEFQVFNTHLEVDIGGGGYGASQAVELSRLADSLQVRLGKRGRLQVALGDLNAEPGTLGHILLKARGFADTYDGVSQDSGTTCCVAGSALWRPDTSFSNLRIDHVMARGMTGRLSSRTALKGVYTLPDGTRFLISDHRMVIARFIAQNP